MNRLPGAFWVVVPVVLGILLAQHHTAGDPVIDGWPIGPEVGCNAAGSTSASVTALDGCSEYIDLADAALDRRDPGHAAVVSVALHEEGFIVDGLGYRHGPNDGGCCVVAKFDLADGSVSAIGVGNAGIDPSLRIFDYGSCDASTC